MANVADHYENHLADHYSWLFGGIKIQTEVNRIFFEEHSITPRGSGLAVDLGCGSGFQSIALANIGFDVTAIDLSEKLLLELNNNSGGLAVKTIKDDILKFQNYVTENNIELVVCMGDTITHLESKGQIIGLFKKSFQSLEKDGKLILTFRDLTRELKGPDRFIPIKSDKYTIFTCFLEYEPETVKVHDLVYENVNGKWVLRKSFYHKIRLAKSWVKEQLSIIGFSVEESTIENGIITLIAKKTTKPLRKS